MTTSVLSNERCDQRLELPAKAAARIFDEFETVATKREPQEMGQRRNPDILDG